jgi:hypothetical protein
LAVALSEAEGSPFQEQGGPLPVDPPGSARPPAPRRAPAVVFPASDLVNESDAERNMRLRARAEAERAIVARQAKLNAAKAGQPKRKGS